MALIAVVGRPNVGKSTLINRIIGKREAIVQETPGVTRDRKYLKGEWSGRNFTLIDTGGLDFAETASLTKKIQEQAMFAIREADAILFVVDAKDGLMGADEDVADMLRRSEKPVVLVVNKWDDPNYPPMESIFYKLGLGDPFSISAIHGLGIGDLLDVVIALLPEEDAVEEETAAKLAIVGRPNVGKSSILNKILRKDRSIVSETAGTTRDTIDSLVVQEGKTYLYIDTAGLRRKAKVTDDVEYYSSLRVLEALDRAEIALLVIDAEEGVTDQDQRVAAAVDKRGRACIVLLNKWDLVPGDEAEDLLEDMKEKLQFINYAPFLTISAATGRGLERLPKVIDKVAAAYRDRIPTADLNRFVDDYAGVLEGAAHGKPFRILYGTQVKAEPPTLLFFTSLRLEVKAITKTYKKTVENRLRENFDFTGCPIRLRFRAKEAREQRA